MKTPIFIAKTSKGDLLIGFFCIVAIYQGKENLVLPVNHSKVFQTSTDLQSGSGNMNKEPRGTGSVGRENKDTYASSSQAELTYSLTQRSAASRHISFRSLPEKPSVSLATWRRSTCLSTCPRTRGKSLKTLKTFTLFYTEKKESPLSIFTCLRSFPVFTFFES